MGDAASEIQQLTRLQHMRASFGRDVDGALDALNSDFSRHAMQWQ